MRKFLVITIAAWFSILAPAHAEEQPVVLELYTSQGCSSCPPADRLMNELTKRPDVIALSLHVDYWDYIGWKDIFADPAFTERQRRYAQAAGTRTIYTPQMIIGGVDHVVGNHSMAVAETLMRHKMRVPKVEISVTRNGLELTVSAKARSSLDSAAIIQLVQFSPEETVSITRGENAGRTLRYHNVVRSWQVVGEWSGIEPLELIARTSEAGLPAVVLIQAANHGPMLAAARAH